MLEIRRRTFLKGSLASGVAGVAAGLGLITPQALLADWNQSAFTAQGVPNSLHELWGSSEIIKSSKVEVKAPAIAENGAVVPITISSSLPNVESMAILVENNPVPLTSSYDLVGGNTLAFIKTRIKMGKTSQVIGVVKSDGKLYSGSTEVKVTIGGCGG